MTIARPTATSVTVIAIVKSVSTQPATAPLLCAKATRLMLTAFSMSSRPRRMPTAFRRVRTPKSPIANMAAARRRDPVSTGGRLRERTPPSDSFLGPGEVESAEERGDQKDTEHLEGEDPVGQHRAAKGGGGEVRGRHN